MSSTQHQSEQVPQDLFGVQENATEGRVDFSNSILKEYWAKKRAHRSFFARRVGKRVQTCLADGFTEMVSGDPPVAKIP